KRSLETCPTPTGCWWAWPCNRWANAAQMRVPMKQPLTKTGSRSRQGTHVLRLYVSGTTVKSKLAVTNIKRVCEEHLKGRYHLKVIDIRGQAHLARDEQIVAV